LPQYYVDRGTRKAASSVDDKLKEQLLPTVMVFNFVLAIYMCIRVVYPMLMSNRPLRSGTFFTQLLIGSAIAIVPAAFTFVIMLRRK
jgi:hypothetical protein